MDRSTAVALSMLPASRSRAAAAFKELRHRSRPSSCKPLLELLWCVCHDRRGPPRSARVVAILAAAARSRSRRASVGIVPFRWYDRAVSRRCSTLHRRSAAGPVGPRRRGGARRGRPWRSSGRAPPSPYALDVAHRLAAELPERGIVVASGLARGVDSAAHRGCLDAGGADSRGARIRARRRLSSRARRRWPLRFRRTGLLVSELGARRAAAAGALSAAEPYHQRDLARGRRRRSLGEERVAHHRPMRAEQGRDVMAVPGSVLSAAATAAPTAFEGRSKGCRVCGRYS